MGFILDGLESEDYDRQYSDRELLERIISYFRPYTKEMILVAVMIALNSAATIAGPILIAKAIDMLSVQSSTRAIVLLSLGVMLLGVAAWVFNFIRQWFSARVTGNVVLQLRKDVFSATVRHDMSFYDDHPSGKIVSRITSDTQDFAETVNLTLNLLSQILLVIVLTLWLFTINVPLTLILLAMAPVAVVIALSFRRIARRVTQNAKRATAVINAQIQESISGIVVAKNFRQEQAIYETFEKNNRQGYRTGVQRGLTMVSIFPIMGLASGLGTAVLLFFGGLATANPGSGVTTGDWYLYMQAVGFYWFPLMGIASFWSQFQDGLAAAERDFALIDLEPKVKQTGNEPVDHLKGAIDFDHVRFSYTDKEIVLPDFSLSIKPGETVALVGHTGAGKSSIAKLAMRFYEFQDGKIKIDGRDIRSLDLSQYRLHTGFVPQDPFLFSGTVGENIAYGRPGATPEEIAAAANTISGGEWLATLPDGLDTDVGERGGSLSMGQRQLVALARVVLKDPGIFILDEATASVDPFTETQIQESLDEIMAARTAIVIAHRLSTVRHADRIIVMADGGIIEEGTHDELLAQGGHYAELYNTYFRHQSLEYIDSWAEEVEEITAD
ncbi:MAG: ABC transporter ATP-binding protein [Candidatus Promineifilaceae bacterium]|jgi:ABC-type multidrug transport system fused ATPase/permease subunit